MSHRPVVSVALIATGPERLVGAALAVLAGQRDADVNVVVICDQGREEYVCRQLAARTPRHGAEFVATRGEPPGAVLNLALELAAGSYFVVVDGAEILPPDYLATASSALENDAAAGFAAARGDFTPSDSASLVDLPLLLAGPWSIAAPVLRRTSAVAAGRFDESLPDLAMWDLLLSLAEQGNSGILVPDVTVRRAAEDDVRLREALGAGRHLPALRKVFAKHRSSFEAHAAGLLVDRERIARRLWVAERELLDRRERIQRELIAVQDELAAIRAELQTAGRSTLEWSDLRRVTPLSRNWGLDRGRPIDRHYIDAFIARHAADIRGTVLEMLDPGMTRVHGGDRVLRSDVLDIDPANDRATIVADLRAAQSIPDDTYDCFILTQTLQLIDDIAGAIEHAYRILKPGGVLLATLPCVSMVAHEYGVAGDHWRVTEAGARRLFERRFAPADLTIEARGNVLACAAFLYGLACDELDPAELEFDDPDYPLIVSVRAVKPAAPTDAAIGMPLAGSDAPRPPKTARTSPPGQAVATRSIVLLYHRVASPSHDRYRLAVPPDEFRRQLEYLCTAWRPMSLSDMAAAADSGAIPDRAVALTFDDGYLDNLEEALPILQEHGAPATFFVTSEPLARPHGFWWDRLEGLLLDRRLPASFALEIDGVVRSIGARGTAVHDELYAVFQGSLPAVRDDLLWQLERSLATREPGDPRREPRAMTAAEIRRLAAQPRVEIGAHGVHHVRLPGLDPEHMFREISECRTALEAVIERPVVLFAYPYGAVSSETVQMVRSAGYSYAFTCDERPLGAVMHPLRLPRIPAPTDAPAMRQLLARLGG